MSWAYAWTAAAVVLYFSLVGVVVSYTLIDPARQAATFARKMGFFRHD